jgi:UDP-glucose:(heptosyl)LPS alpha-1,3-glucosyltransferase
MKTRRAGDKKIAVAVVTPRYGLVGGAESCVYHLSEQLSFQEDFEIHVFANRWSDESPRMIFHRVPIIRYPRSLRPISFAYFSRTLVEKGTFDLIHSHGRIFHMDILTMHGLPHIAWVKDVRHKRLSLFDRTTAWVEKHGLTGCFPPVVLPVSSLVKEELVKLYGIPETRMQVVHPGVSPERFSALDREACRHEIRTRHGLLFTDIVILFVGLNYEVKRLNLVLEGVADLVRRNPESRSVKLLIVGKGPSNRYLSMARSLGIADRCFFSGVTHEIEKYYLASDIFLMPSSYDTFGLVVLEAMMAGLPVIITEKVGAGDLVQSGIQGFVLRDQPSPMEVAEKVTFLLNRENRLAMGEHARRTALKHTWQETGKVVAEIYRSLSGDRRKRACPAG